MKRRVPLYLEVVAVSAMVLLAYLQGLVTTARWLATLFWAAK